MVESPFDAVRLRTAAAKRFTKVANATALLWRVLLVVEQPFRTLNATHRCAEVYAGATYRAGRRIRTKRRPSSPSHTQ
ncbi:MAG TPA: hypothetical protein VFK13_14505 [Gemmatimonadaceae bacterium]|nr:hypothetical protein [Gemmatimonadaceae bacterium]